METPKGHLHPLTIAIRELYDIFAHYGFDVAYGPEIETEFFNFDALNVPADHPARDMQDTFWLKQKNEKGEKLVLRTHTTSVDVRYMLKHKPPFRVIIPGKVFRNEATDATHEAQFHQMDALMIEKDLSMAKLKSLLLDCFRAYFGPKTTIRFRPSFFGFTEPSVEIDVLRNGKWLEVLGGGMLHENVMKAGGLDPADGWRGIAFGGGLDRLIVLKYGIPDVRLLYSADLRLINQF